MRRPPPVGAAPARPALARLSARAPAAPQFPDARLHIIAADTNAVLLERARRAIYPASALEELPASWRSRAFEALGGVYRLRDEFRRGVEFHEQDIRKDIPGGSFDLILCRNLAFTYFELELQRTMQRNLAQRLVPGGALLIGAHEALPEPPALALAGEARSLYRAPNETAQVSAVGSPVSPESRTEGDTVPCAQGVPASRNGKR